MSIFGFTSSRNYCAQGMATKARHPQRRVIRHCRGGCRYSPVRGLGRCSWGWPASAILQMIAEMFHDRDWDSDDGPDVKMVIEGLAGQDTWSAAASPRDVVQPVQLAEHLAKSIRPQQFQDARLRAAMEQDLLQALLWGAIQPRSL